MKNIMKQAADTGYMLLWLKQNDFEKYETTLEFGKPIHAVLGCAKTELS
jgi:hypothetical protein